MNRPHDVPRADRAAARGIPVPERIMDPFAGAGGIPQRRTRPRPRKKRHRKRR